MSTDKSNLVPNNEVNEAILNTKNKITISRLLFFAFRINVVSLLQVCKASLQTLSLFVFITYTLDDFVWNTSNGMNYDKTEQSQTEVVT